MELANMDTRCIVGEVLRMTKDLDLKCEGYETLKNWYEAGSIEYLERCSEDDVIWLIEVGTGLKLEPFVYERYEGGEHTTFKTYLDKKKKYEISVDVSRYSVDGTKFHKGQKYVGVDYTDKRNGYEGGCSTHTTVESAIKEIEKHIERSKK